MKLVSIMLLCVMTLSSINLISGAKIVQQIDGGNYGYTTTSGSFAPTDGEMGIVNVNLSKYANVSEAYFEIVYDVDYSGIPNGAASALISLYDMDNDVDIEDSWIIVGQTAGFLIARSSNVSYFWENCTNGCDVYPHMYVGNPPTDTITIRAWRIIIYQEGDISSTITYIPVSDNQAEAGAAYNNVDYPKYWVFNYSKYDGSLNVKFCATLENNTAGTIYAELYGGGAVSGSEVSSSGSPVFNCSGNLTLTTGTEYTTYVKVDAGSGIIRNAFLVVEQTGMSTTNGKLETVMQLTNNYRSHAGAYDSGYFYNWYNQTDWDSSTRTFYGEYVLRVTARIAPMEWAHLTDDGVAIANSEVTHSTSTYTRVTSSSFSEPNGQIDDGIKSGTGSTAYISSGRMIIDITGLGVAAGGECWSYNAVNGEYYIPTGCECYCTQEAQLNLSLCTCE